MEAVRPLADPSIRVSLVSLGCPRNLVDSEVMVGRFTDGPFEIQQEPAGADVVVVNTCAFIGPAREESIDTICEMLELKARGDVKGVVVAGCMVQRYGAELIKELPDVDAFLDLSDYTEAPDILRKILARQQQADSPARAEAGAPFLSLGGEKTAAADLGRALLTLPHTAYLRVSEGCDRQCSFCAIPGIRGKQRSKPLEMLLDECNQLVEAGVRELVLVGEETTAYGSDVGYEYGEGIAPLLEGMAGIRDLAWVRLMYAHPGSFRPSLLQQMRDNPKVVPYLDMPVQHGDDEVLKRMKRGTPTDRMRRLIADLRREIPEITLRTTILVGFPGETDRRFENLLDFLAEARFERLGCFAYSREEGTASYELGSRVSARKAAERRREVMLRQREITAERNRALVGQTIPILVDEAGEDRGIGRTEGDAPQIDCRVVLTGAGLVAGTFIEAEVTGTDGYDLEARAVGPLASVGAGGVGP